MDLVRDIYAKKRAASRPVISFEFFPPKTEEGDRNLLEKTIPALLQRSPDYCSVTYGAGGSTRAKTLSIVDQIKKRHQFTTLAHLTCVSAAKSDIEEFLDQIRGVGVHNLLALRGDPPGGGEFVPRPDGFEFSEELVRYIKAKGDYCVGVAGFPEGHIACKEGKHKDWEYLARKVRAGADFVITQLFFDNRDYFEFRDAMVKQHGVTVPLVPGIIPIQSASQIKKFTALCGAKVPPALGRRLDEIGENEEAAAQFGIEYAAAQCEELLREGAPGIHFYTLNKSKSTVAVLERLGIGSGGG